jgi:DNA-binding Lrp family transcriptional regulator
MFQGLEKPKTEEVEIAYVLATCEGGFEPYVAEQIKSLEGIKEVTTTLGPYDIIARIEAPSTEILGELIRSKIRKISKVRTTTTIVCGHSF